MSRIRLSKIINHQVHLTNLVDVLVLVGDADSPGAVAIVGAVRGRDRDGRNEVDGEGRHLARPVGLVGS